MEETHVLCAAERWFCVAGIWRMEGLRDEVIFEAIVGVSGCDAASQVMDATVTEEGRNDGEESPGGDLRVVDFGLVGFFAVDDDEVAVPGG